MQHPRLRKRQIEPRARARDGHVHQPALFFQPVLLGHRVLVRKQSFFQAGDEDRVELEPLGRVHGHQLDRLCALRGLVIAGLERGVREEGGQRRHLRLIGSGQPRNGCAPVRGVGVGRPRRSLCRGDVPRQVGRHVAELGHESGRGVDQFTQVLDTLLAFALAAIVREKTAALDHVLHGLGKRHRLRLGAQRRDQSGEGGQRLAAAPSSSGTAASSPDPAAPRRLAAPRRCARQCRAPGNSPPAGKRHRRRGFRSNAGRQARA